MSDFLAKPLRKPAMVAAVLRALRQAARGGGGFGSLAVPAVLDRMALAHLTAAIGEDGVRETFAVFASETDARRALFRSRRTPRVDRDRGLCLERFGPDPRRQRDVRLIARLIEHRAASISADELLDAIGWLDEANRRMRREFEADFTQVA